MTPKKAPPPSKELVGVHPIPWARAFLPIHMPAESPPFHWEVADLIFGDKPRVALAAPRGHAKSTITDLICLLYGAAHKKFRYCLLVSDSSEQAELFLQEIKQEVENNERLRAFYPGLAPSRPWAGNDLCFQNGVRIQALGSGKKFRGRKQRGTRPDLILVDDLENDEQVASLERRLKLRRWFRATLLPVLAPGGRVRVIGTILHSDSLLSRLLRSESWDRRKWRALSDQNVALWPGWRPAEKLLREKAEAQADGMLSTWYQENQNQAIATEECAFRPEDFTFFSELPKGRVYKSLFVDPAISQKESADYTGYTVVYAHDSGVWHVMEAFRRRDDPATVIDTVRRRHVKHDLDTIGIESVQYQKALAFFLNQEGEDDPDLLLPIEEVVPDGDKRRRIMSLQPYFRARRIKFHENLPGRLEMELVNLDSTDHDDLADSLAGHLFITLRPEPPEKRRKKMMDPASERAYNHRKELARRARLKRRGIEE